MVARASQQAGTRGGRTAANLESALSIGEALGPLVAGVIWDVAGLATFFTLRAVLGVGVEVVVGRRLRGEEDRAAAAAPVAAATR